MLTACHKQLLFNDKVEYMIFRSGSLGIFLKTILFPLIKKFQGLLGPNFRHNIKHETRNTRNTNRLYLEVFLRIEDMNDLQEPCKESRKEESEDGEGGGSGSIVIRPWFWC